MTLGTVKVPTIDQLKEVAEDLGFSMSEADLAQHHETMHGYVAAYNIIDRMPDEVPQVTYPRTPGYRPMGDENKYGAWYVKTTVKGAARGKLKDKKIALKDNICLAGVPMMNGSSTLEGYMPDVDATVVTRILDAGGTIMGKAVCEHFCFSGGSHTSSSGPVHNPHRHGYSAGGSSSGSAALVAAGEVDMALGGDQGGSIRMPASFCGIYGLKPTHGLVPYTGIMPIELTIDHTGPMTANVADNALLLEVVAGPDGLDPRQYGGKPPRYTEALGKDAKGMRIAVVKEGFGWPKSMPELDAVVRKAADAYKGLGATVEEVSIPMHLMGGAIWLPVAAEGATMQMMLGNGFGFNWQGLYVTSLLDFHSGWRDPRRRALGHTEKYDAARPLHGEPPSRPLLRQSAKPGAPPARRLRRRARELRPSPHADAAAHRNEAAGRERARGRDHRARLRDPAQHGPLRLHPPPGHEPPLRHRRRPARRHAAGGQALRRAHHLQGRPRLRAGRGLARHQGVGPPAVRAGRAAHKGARPGLEGPFSPPAPASSGRPSRSLVRSHLHDGSEGALTSRRSPPQSGYTQWEANDEA